MDTSVIDSDYEDHESGLSGEGDSVIHDSTFENDISSNSVQTDSEQEFEEEEIEPSNFLKLYYTHIKCLLLL